LQTAQLSRPRVYNDDLQHYDLPPPLNAPNWACVGRDDNEIMKHIFMIEGNLESQDIRNSDEAETSITGMIQGTISLGQARQGTKGGECIKIFNIA
jgi:hypothetical protein